MISFGNLNILSVLLYITNIKLNYEEFEGAEYFAN